MMKDDDQRLATGEASGRNVNWLALLLAALVIGALVAFIVQNTEEAPIEFLAWKGRQPLWLLIVISAALGGLLMRLLSWMLHLRRRLKY